MIPKFTQCSPKASRSHRVSVGVEALSIVYYEVYAYLSIASLLGYTATSTGEKSGLEQRKK